MPHNDGYFESLPYGAPPERQGRRGPLEESRWNTSVIMIKIHPLRSDADRRQFFSVTSHPPSWLRLVAIIVAILSDTASVQAQSQPIRVSLSFTDSVGAVRSAFAGALRSLPDIDVITPGEDFDIEFTAVVICGNPCASYAIALQVAEPPVDWFLETQSESALRYAEALRYNITMYVLNWGRQRYEQAARDLVREIDSACFERIRIQRRARRLLMEGDTAAWLRARGALLDDPYQRMICG